VPPAAPASISTPSTPRLHELCLAEALADGEPWGTWGGLDTDEREALAEQIEPFRVTVGDAVLILECGVGLST
jgi:transcription factor WhiB